MLGATVVPHARGRLKLARQEIYAFVGHRGAIDERWFSSTIRADNGPNTPELVETLIGIG